MPSTYNDDDAPKLPPIEELLDGPPSWWQGMAVSWISTVKPVPSFLGRFRTEENDCDVEAFLFAARYELSEALLDGHSLGDGFFVEYFVVTGSAECGWKVRRLVQRNSVTFSDSEEAKDYILCRSMQVRDSVAGRLPAWESAEEAVWPTSHGELMDFLGQVRLAENSSSGSAVVWGMTVYLFRAHRNNGEFKVVVQPNGMQTPEEHYASEDRLPRT